MGVTRTAGLLLRDREWGKILADDVPKPDQVQLTAVQFASAMNELKTDILQQARNLAAQEATRIADARPPAGWWDAAWRIFCVVPRFFSSGLFFIVLGGLLLKIAYETMGGTLSAFSFVLVVLGIAVLLYGTGTQGMARFQSGTSAGYNVAIAGGAGVLAFVAAWGITEKQSEMKTAFNVQKQYTRVPFKHIDNSEVLGLYTFEFSIDGLAVPAMRQGNSLEILVPYTAIEFSRPGPNRSGLPTPQTETPTKHTQPDDMAACFDQLEISAQPDKLVKTVRANLYLRPVDEGRESTNRANLEPSLKKDYRIWIMKPALFDGGYDLPRSEKSVCLNLVSQSIAMKISDKASNRTEPLAKNEATSQQATDVPKNPPAADIKQIGTGKE
jgi:hypothetical protein